ncbi:ATP synthase subunit I [Schnuerera sp. xch1]|uniref:ATP synthase subunit I n=1 Tax=Schnuerera sp. xch1 TaxID=2874283 RepID=UPI001CBFE9FA|nr:ATP synthase subunit I [Schnuerera sp. xch1]MBZ2174922.1 ATP synthase subunit I [Schnuerera sp. xch1]
MKSDKNLSYVIIKKTIVYSLIIIGIIFLGFKNYKPLILGFVFGTTISILGFKLLENTINNSIKMSPDRAYRYTIFHYFVRYLIYGIVLIVAAIANYLSFVTTAIGLFMIKIVIITYTIYDSFFKRKNRKK